MILEERHDLPCFSIVIPVYNVAQYIRQCVDSVLSQDFTAFELILVDDGSPDCCPDICDEYAMRDSRVTVIHKQNGGLSDARNSGIAAAQGAYLIFIDGDDYWDGTDCLSQIREAAQDNPDVILYGARKRFDSTGRVESSRRRYDSLPAAEGHAADLLRVLVEKDLISVSAWSKAIRTELLRQKCIAFERGLLGEDLDWSLNIMLHAKRYAIVDQDFYIYRQRGSSITHSLTLKNLTDKLHTIVKWATMLNDREVEEGLRATLLKYLAKEYSNLIIVYSLVKDFRKRQHKEDVLAFAWLLEHSAARRSRVVRRMLQLLGFDCTVFLLANVVRMKRWCDAVVPRTGVDHE